jgi:hypothetical protein
LPSLTELDIYNVQLDEDISSIVRGAKALRFINIGNNIDDHCDTGKSFVPFNPAIEHCGGDVSIGSLCGVTTIALGYWCPWVFDVNDMGAFDGLTELRIHGGYPKEVDIRVLPATLRKLVVDGSVNASLTGCKHLESISIDVGRRRTAAMLMDACDLPALKELRVGGYYSTYGEYGILSKMTGLTRLDLTTSYLDMRLLSCLTNLVDLRMHVFDGGSVGQHHLSALTSLRRISLRDFYGISELVNVISRIPTIEELSIKTGEAIRIGDPFGSLAMMTGLTSLSVRCDSVADVHIMGLSRLTNLRVLVLRSDNLTDVSIRTITSLKMLEHLDVSRSRLFTRMGLICMCGLPRLRRLDLHHSVRVPEYCRSCGRFL